MNKWILCVVALILGMLMFHLFKGACGCKTVVEGMYKDTTPEDQKVKPQDYKCKKYDHAACQDASNRGQFKKGYWSQGCCNLGYCSEDQRPGGGAKFCT